MDLFKAFIIDPKNTRYDGEDRDETIKYVLRRSIITTLPTLLLIGIMIVLPFFIVMPLSGISYNNVNLISPAFLLLLGLFWYIITFGFALQSFLNWFFNVFIVTNKKIVDIDFNGVLFKNISETTLDNVEDVTSTVKGALGIIFNIGEVYIQTAGEKREFEFTQIDNPAAIRDIIADLVAKVKRNGNN